MKKFLLIVLFFIFFIELSAQYKQGLQYFNKFDYYKAIPKLKHCVKIGNKDRTDALVKLGDSYRFLRDFKNAAVYYKLAIESDTVESLVHYYYGTVLKCNNKYEEALAEFNLYLKKNPSNSKAKTEIKSCIDIKASLSLPKEYHVTNLSAINTENSEFCPVLYNNQFIFVSCKGSDLVNFEKSDFDGRPFLTIYYSQIKNDSIFSKKKNFSKKINSNFHDGPICFKDSNTIYFTRVEYKEEKKNKEFINRPKIFYATRKGKTWQKPISFTYNSDAYCLAHPSVSADGNFLYFASDMSGGMGGMDLWVCKKEGEGWAKPENLGPDINTSGNEEFPYIRKDGILFFSSDGLPGFGGLDI